MTDKEQRNAIAKICGWTYDPDTESMVAADGNNLVAYDWPSLEAMHQAEKTLDDDSWFKFDNVLAVVVYIHTKKLRSSSACAEHRLEAFIRAKGLWHD